MEPKVEDVGPSGFICTQKQRENVLVSFTSLTDACSSSINEHSRRKGVKSVEVGGENDARGRVPPAKTQKRRVSMTDAVNK